jgi:hypothetical protein
MFHSETLALQFHLAKLKMVDIVASLFSHFCKLFTLIVERLEMLGQSVLERTSVRAGSGGQWRIKGSNDCILLPASTSLARNEP